MQPEVKDARAEVGADKVPEVPAALEAKAVTGNGTVMDVGKGSGQALHGANLPAGEIRAEVKEARAEVGVGSVPEVLAAAGVKDVTGNGADVGGAQKSPVVLPGAGVPEVTADPGKEVCGAAQAPSDALAVVAYQGGKAADAAETSGQCREVEPPGFIMVHFDGDIPAPHGDEETCELLRYTKEVDKQEGWLQPIIEACENHSKFESYCEFLCTSVLTDEEVQQYEFGRNGWDCVWLFHWFLENPEAFRAWVTSPDRLRVMVKQEEAEEEAPEEPTPKQNPLPSPTGRAHVSKKHAAYMQAVAPMVPVKGACICFMQFGDVVSGRAS